MPCRRSRARSAPGAGPRHGCSSRLPRKPRRPRPETVERLLAALFDRPSAVLGRYRAEIIELAHRNRLGNVLLFGSVQRGTDQVGSDIDLLATSAKGASAVDMAGFVLDVDELDRSRVDVASSRGASPVFDAIRAQAVAL